MQSRREQCSSPLGLQIAQRFALLWILYYYHFSLDKQWFRVQISRSKITYVDLKQIRLKASKRMPHPLIRIFFRPPPPGSLEIKNLVSEHLSNLSRRLYPWGTQNLISTSRNLNFELYAKLNMKKNAIQIFRLTSLSHKLFDGIVSGT